MRTAVLRRNSLSGQGLTIVVWLCSKCEEDAANIALDAEVPDLACAICDKIDLPLGVRNMQNRDAQCALDPAKFTAQFIA